ncbi:unnamed protein product [Heterobilharzia americana]|nr:unnamed protein product [Heterobilharzia americana]
MRYFECSVSLRRCFSLHRFCTLAFPRHYVAYYAHVKAPFKASLGRCNRIFIPSYSFSSVANNRTCWSCNRLVPNVAFFCECGMLQPFNDNWTYFDVLGYSCPQIVVDINDLTDRMRRTQRILHPDKFSKKSSYERKIASDASALVNKAYDILRKPVSRFEYILNLHGISTDDSCFQKSDNSVFLSEVMQIREEVEEVIYTITNFDGSGSDLSALTNNLSKLVNDLRRRLNDEEKTIVSNIEKSDWSSALVSLSQYKYIMKIQEQLREHELIWKQLGINVTTA